MAASGGRVQGSLERSTSPRCSTHTRWPVALGVRSGPSAVVGVNLLARAWTRRHTEDAEVVVGPPPRTFQNEVAGRAVFPCHF